MVALVVSVVCLAANAFFVAAEFAIVKVRLTQIEPRARRGERRAVAAAAVLAQLDRYLSVTQVGITIASLGLGWVAEPAIEAFGDRVAIAVTGAALGRVGHIVVDVLGLGTLTFLHVLVGELVPKAIAIRHSESTALTTALPLRAVNLVLTPVLWILERAQHAVLRLLDVDPHMTEGSLSEEEIVGILGARAAEDAVAEDKQKTVARVLRFATRPVRQIMVPRVDVVALPIDTSGQGAFALLKKHEYSRVLLHAASLDEVVGYLYAKDFLFDEDARSREDLRGLERQALFVPEQRECLAVFREMQRTGIPLAVVIDEYGGTSGMVTAEDLVEEVLGEIHDESDAEPEKIVRLDEATPAWDVDARATVDELRDAGIPLVTAGIGEPIGKLVLDHLAHMPRVGDVATFAEGILVEVVATSRRRIQRLRVRLRPEPARDVGGSAPGAPLPTT